MTICGSHRLALPVFLARRIAGNRLQNQMAEGTKQLDVGISLESDGSADSARSAAAFSLRSCSTRHSWNSSVQPCRYTYQSRQQLHAQRQFKSIDQPCSSLQGWDINLGVTRPEICRDFISFQVLEPNHIKRARISNSLTAMQVATVKPIQEVRQPWSVRSIFVSLKTQVERILKSELFDASLKKVRQLLDFEQRALNPQDPISTHQFRN